MMRGIQRAHQLMAQEDYIQAAELFERLARNASRHGLRHTPQLYLQAGRARILAGSIDAGMKNLHEAMVQFSTSGQTGRMPHVTLRVIQELRSQGLMNEAEALEAQARELLSVEHISMEPHAEDPGESLPSKCPYCGAIVHPKEVEWIDSRHAVCSFCGSVVGDQA